MKNKRMFAAVAAVAVLLALAIVLPAAAKGMQTYTFDDSTKPFALSSNDQFKTAKMGFQVEYDSPFGGMPNGFFSLKMVPESTDATVWMIAEADQVPLDAGSNDVDIPLQVKNLGGCASCIPAVY